MSGVIPVNSLNYKLLRLFSLCMILYKSAKCYFGFNVLKKLSVLLANMSILTLHPHTLPVTLPLTDAMIQRGLENEGRKQCLKTKSI